MVEGVNTDCEPLSASHMHLQWQQQRCSIPRSLGGDKRRSLSPRSTAKILQSHWQTSSARSVNHHPIFYRTPRSSGHLLFHRVSAFLHLSSHTFPGSASPLPLIPTDCPSLDNALASFDALLLESRVV